MGEEESQPIAKRKTTRSMWNLALSRNNPLQTLLIKAGESNPKRYVRIDGSVNKTLLMTDILQVGLHAFFTEQNDLESLQVVTALREGTTPTVPQTTSVSVPTSPATTSPSESTTRLQPRKRRTIKIKDFIIDEGHARIQL